MQCFILLFFFNYHFLRLEKYEDESKLLTLELKNKSAELGKICKKKKTKLGNKNAFCCFLKMGSPYCLEKWFERTLYLSGMPEFVCSSDSLFSISLTVIVAVNSQTAGLCRPPVVRSYRSLWFLCLPPVKADSAAGLSSLRGGEPAEHQIPGDFCSL